MTSNPQTSILNKVRKASRATSDLVLGLAPVTQAGVLGSMGPGAAGKALSSI